MNEFDRDNLDFFINTSQDEFDEWMDQASDLELNYAMALIRTARRELTESELKLLDEIQDTSQANELLKQFTLGK
jgi:hypothetical protein